MRQFSGGTCWRKYMGLAATSLGIVAIGPMPARADVTTTQVNEAVDKAVVHLLSIQKPDGSWEDGAKPTKAPGDTSSEDAKWGGETAIATYSLLAAGQRPTVPGVKKAIEWLISADLHGTYAVGLRSQVWHLIPETSRGLFGANKIEEARDHDRDYVLAARIHKGRNEGFYGYAYGNLVTPGASSTSSKSTLNPEGPPSDSWYDRSNSQYGVLGAWALEQAGAEIPVAFWQEEDTAWKTAQAPTGGWSYRTDDNEIPRVTPAMTAAGIATLFITQDYVSRTGHQFDSCHGGTTNSNIDKGLAWMDKHIAVALAKPGDFQYYFLYGIERIGVASGRKYFGTIDWFKSGAETIVKGQGGDGSWGSVHDTCFAILFLTRGRAPVMMNKLIYHTASKKQVDPWNERPRDAANLAHWMGDHALDNTILNWQVVTLDVSPDELHDAPILYLAGSEELSLSNQDIEKLRQFVEQGGMIVGNADCGSHNFSQSFWKLGTRMFPKYESRKLSATHLIYDEMFKATKWRTHPVVEGLSNGVRELMLLVPEADLGRAWQTESTKTRQDSFELAANMFIYATGRENLFDKGDTYIVHATEEAGKEIKLARIDVGDNSDPEPAAWPRVSAFLHNTQHVDVKPEMVKLGSSALAGYKIAALTGTTKLILSDAQRAELKDFVQKGGTLIVDAAGGSSEFATTAEEELKKTFGPAGEKGMSEILPATDSIYKDSDGKTEQVDYRSFARHVMTGNAHSGRIHGITVGGRIGVFYSREDLTAGCVGEQIDGIVGYTPEVATRLMANMVMYAVNGDEPSHPTADAK